MKIHSKGAFLEVMNSSFPIRKVQFNFFNYDNNNKITNSINIYVDIEKILPLINEVKSGQFVDKFVKSKQTGMYQGKPVDQYTGYFTDQGGRVNNGQAISRVFKIQESRRPGNWNFYAAEGPGELMPNGLIKIAGRPTSFINIPVTHTQIVTMMMKIEMHLQAYTSLIMNKFAERAFTGVFSGNPNEEYTSYFYEKTRGGNLDNISQTQTVDQNIQTQNFEKGHNNTQQFNQPNIQSGQNNMMNKTGGENNQSFNNQNSTLDNQNNQNNQNLQNNLSNDPGYFDPFRRG